MFRSFRFLRLQAVMLCLGVLLFWPALGSAGGRKDSPKGSYGSGDEVFDSTPVTFTLAGGSTFTLQSRVRCETFPPGDCISANSIFPYFYAITIGPTAISQKITIKISAPFDPHNSPSLSFGILDEPDLDNVGTHIAACSTDACVDGVLAATSSYQNNVLEFDLDPSTLSTGQFAPGDQIWVYATSFSPPACTLDYTTTNVLTCSQASSLTGTLSVSAPGSTVSPSSTPGLVPVPPVPHKIVAPAETSYFNPDSVFSGNIIDAQTTQGTTTTPLSGFITSTVDLAHCNFCSASTNNVLYGYLYNLQIPSTFNTSALPGTFTVTINAPFNQDNFEFLSFGVLGTDGNATSSVVANCPAANPNSYNSCLNNVVSDAKVLPTSLTFTIVTTNLSPGDNLELFAASNNKPNSCNTNTGVCASTSPISLLGDAGTTLALTASSPTTVTGPSDPIPQPVINSLTPGSIAQGSAAITLTVDGSPVAPGTDDFVAGAQVFWNGSARNTTFVSPTRLTAQISATDLQTAAIVPVTVRNPANPSTTATPNGGLSNAVNFTITGSMNPVPSLTSINPTSAPAGGPGFKLTVNGSGFIASTVVKFNGKSETTTFVNATQVTAAISAGDIATAGTFNVTATNPAPGGGTSGALTFSVTSGKKPPVVVSVTPNSGTGLTQTFAAVVSDPNGLADLKTMHLSFSTTSANQASACSVYYIPGTNQLFLYGDNGTTLLGPMTPGVAGTRANSQCTLNAAGSSIVKSGNNMTLKAAITFKPAFTGLKNSYVYSAANNGTNTGWVKIGTWTGTRAAPMVVSVTPNSGTGLTQTFAAVVSDPNGLADLKTLHLSFSTTSANQASACSVYYIPGTNQLFLYGDNGTTLLGPMTPGVAGTRTNNQCTLNAAGTSIGKSGNNMTLNAAITFKSTFTGLKNSYIYSAANNGTNTGWVKIGTWTPAPPVPF